MSTRVCKVCLVEKDYSYLCLNSQGRLVYKNEEDGSVWHSRVCYPCFKSYVKKTSGKEPLGDKLCACGKTFKQKNIKQVACCKRCYSSRKDKV